jgi:PAS domain S-box-containing protein
VFDSALAPVRLNSSFRTIADGMPEEAVVLAKATLESGAAARRAPLTIRGRRFLVDVHPVGPEQPGVALILADVTEASTSAQRLKENEGQLRQVLDAVMAFALVLDGDGVVMEANAQALAAAGLTPNDVRGLRLEDTYWFSGDEEARGRLRDAVRACGRGESAAYRERLRAGPESSVTVDLQAAPIRDAKGRLSRIVISAIDVTNLAAAQESQALLAAELNHRVKNILAIVRALIGQTARRASTKEALAAALEGRVTAMARSVALVSRSQWTGFGLADVLHEQLDSYGSERFRLRGPNFPVTPKAALALALLTYELVTNATKYGALSADDGRVEIGWDLDGDEVRWTWSEHGGPAAAPPAETGFGALLMRSVAEGDLGGALTVEYLSAGLRAALAAPLKNLQGAGATSVAERKASPVAGARVLIVEDSAIIALEVASILEAAGATVLGPAPNVADALALVKAERIDIAVLDLDLGGEPSTPVRAALLAKKIPVLIVAAVPQGGAPTDAPMLPKPFTDQELLTGLAALLRPAQSSAAR